VSALDCWSTQSLDGELYVELVEFRTRHLIVVSVVARDDNVALTPNQAREVAEQLIEAASVADEL
jgi:hypothetical protein